MTFPAKYRPQTLSEIVGQPRAVRFLSRLIADLQEDGSGAAVRVLSGRRAADDAVPNDRPRDDGRRARALAKAVRWSLAIPEDWPLSPVFTDELVRLSVQGFLAMAAGEWRVVEAWESTPGRHARYVGVAVGKPA